MSKNKQNNVDMTNNEIFFGESGITATSANHIANMAKEQIEGELMELENLRFYETEQGLLETGTFVVTKTGLSGKGLEAIPAKLESIAESKALCAWLREAIKAKAHLTRDLENLTMFEWAKNVGKEIPEQPKVPKMPSKEDIIAEYGVGLRNKIFTLEAYAAAYGSAVHPEGGLSKARKDLMKVLTSPNKVSGTGRDTIVDRYTPTVSGEKVDEVFFAIQKKHRNAQAEYNTIMYEAESTAKDRYAAALAEYREQSAKFNEDIANLTAEFNEYVVNERKRISDLKIIIPDNLKEIYQNVKNKTK